MSVPSARARGPKTPKAVARASGWGGKRAGAGRKLTPGRARSAPHRVRVLNVSRHPILVTMRTLPEIPSLRTPRIRALFASVLSAQQDRPHARGFEITAHAMAPKELHMIVERSASGGLAGSAKAQATALRARMSGVFIAFARRLNAVLGRKGKVWSDRWQGRELTTAQDLRAARATLGKPARATT